MSPTKEQIGAYISKVGGKRASQTFSILGKNQQFVNALESPIGKELLRDIKEQVEYLSARVIMEDEPNEKDRFRLRAYIEIGEKWAERINKVEKTLAEIKASADPGTE